MVFFLKRDEALSVIQELLSTCQSLDEIYMCIIPPSATDTPIVSFGYQIHIKKTSAYNEGIQKCIEEVTNRHQLSYLDAREEAKVIIFKKH
jgi:hypothetical protein